MLCLMRWRSELLGTKCGNLLRTSKTVFSSLKQRYLRWQSVLPQSYMMERTVLKAMRFLLRWWIKVSSSRTTASPTAAAFDQSRRFKQSTNFSRVFSSSMVIQSQLILSISGRQLRKENLFLRMRWHRLMFQSMLNLTCRTSRLFLEQVRSKYCRVSFNSRPLVASYQFQLSCSKMRREQYRIVLFAGIFSIILSKASFNVFFSSQLKCCQRSPISCRNLTISSNSTCQSDQ